MAQFASTAEPTKPAIINVPGTPEILVKGITIDLTDAQGNRLFKPGIWSVGELVNQKGEGIRNLRLSVSVNPDEMDDSVVDCKVFTIEASDKERNIILLTPEMQGETAVYRQRIDILQKGVKWKKGEDGVKRKTNVYVADSNDSYIMLALFDNKGNIAYYQIAIISQDNEFFLLKALLRQFTAFRDEKNQIMVPEIITGKYTRWDSFDALTEEVYAPYKELLPYTGACSPLNLKKFDVSSLEDNQLLIQWSTPRRQLSCGIRKDGVAVRIHWPKVKKLDPRFPAFLTEGMIVSYEKLVEPKGNTDFRWEAENVIIVQ